MSSTWIRALTALTAVTLLLAACTSPAEWHELVVETEGTTGLLVGESTQLTATFPLRPDFPLRIAWTSSDEEVVTVNGDGLVTALSPGSATMVGRTTHTVRAIGEITFTVAPVPAVAGVSVSLGASALLIGQTTQATAEVDVIGTADDTVLWSSSNDTVLTVSADGEVTAVGEGEADVIATSTFDDTRTGSAAITVAPVPAVTGVSVSLGASALLIGQTTQATAEVDVIGTADDTVLWSSSNDTVLTVSADGEVTAVSEGEADVIATSTFDDTRTGSAAVTVAPVPAVLSVTVSVSQPSLLLSETATATADVQVVGTATTGVSWSSSDEGVLIVDQAGLVTPVARGTAEVIATSAHDATVRGTSAVQVLEPVVLSISLSKPYDDWMTDEGHWFLADGAFDATATVTTQDASEEVVWSSSDDAIFTVDGSGRVTPLARGTATLTATSTVDPSMSASLSVRVFVPAMSSYTQLALVHLSGTWTAEWIGQVGATASVWSSATSITGTDLDYLNYVFSIQDASMASVTSDGLVTLLSPGSTSLTVRALRRPGGSAILTATHDLIVNP